MGSGLPSTSAESSAPEAADVEPCSDEVVDRGASPPPAAADPVPLPSCNSPLSRTAQWLLARAVPAEHLPRVCGVWSLIVAVDCREDASASLAEAAAFFDAAAASLLETDAPADHVRSESVLREVVALSPCLRGDPALREAVTAFLQAAATAAHGEAARGEAPYDRFDDLLAAWKQRSEAAAHLLLTAVHVSAGGAGGVERTDAAIKALHRSLTLACSLGRFARRLRTLRTSIELGRWPLPCAASPVSWQDLLSRGRASVARGHAVDHTVLSEVVKAVAQCAEGAWKKFEECDALPERAGLLPPPRVSACLSRGEARAVLRLWLLRGHLDLLVTGLWNHETLLEAPPVSATRHLRSGIAALLRVRFGPRAAATVDS